MSGKAFQTRLHLGVSRYVILLVAGVVLLGNLPVGTWSVCLSSFIGEDVPCDAQGLTQCCPKNHPDGVKDPTVVAAENPECENCIQVANHWGNGLYYSAQQKSDWAPASVITPNTSLVPPCKGNQAAYIVYRSPHSTRDRLLASIVLLI